MPRIERGDRRVRTRPDLDPPRQQRGDGIHVLRALLPQPLFVHAAGVAPRRVERRLHRHRDPEHRGTLDLLFGGHLEVLQAVPAGPEVPTGPGVERAVHPLPACHRLLDGRVPDDVHAYLQAP